MPRAAGGGRIAEAAPSQTAPSGRRPASPELARQALTSAPRPSEDPAGRCACRFRRPVRPGDGGRQVVPVVVDLGEIGCAMVSSGTLPPPGSTRPYPVVALLSWPARPRFGRGRAAPEAGVRFPTGGWLPTPHCIPSRSGSGCRRTSTPIPRFVRDNVLRVASRRPQGASGPVRELDGAAAITSDPWRRRRARR